MGSPQGRRWPGRAAGRGVTAPPVLTDCPNTLQAAVANDLEQLLHRPQELLEDLREADTQQLHTALRCLWEDKTGHLVRLRAWRAGKAGAVFVSGLGLAPPPLPPTLGPGPGFSHFL